jgi:hypothetical protein
MLCTLVLCGSQAALAQQDSGLASALAGLAGASQNQETPDWYQFHGWTQNATGAWFAPTDPNAGCSCSAFTNTPDPTAALTAATTAKATADSTLAAAQLALTTAQAANPPNPSAIASAQTTLTNAQSQDAAANAAFTSAQTAAAPAQTQKLAYCQKLLDNDSKLCPNSCDQTAVNKAFTDLQSACAGKGNANGGSKFSYTTCQQFFQQCSDDDSSLGAGIHQSTSDSMEDNSSDPTGCSGLVATTCKALNRGGLADAQKELKELQDQQQDQQKELMEAMGQQIQAPAQQAAALKAKMDADNAADSAWKKCQTDTTDRLNASAIKSNQANQSGLQAAQDALNKLQQQLNDARTAAQTAAAAIATATAQKVAACRADAMTQYEDQKKQLDAQFNCLMQIPVSGTELPPSSCPMQNQNFSQAAGFSPRTLRAKLQALAANYDGFYQTCMNSTNGAGAAADVQIQQATAASQIAQKSLQSLTQLVNTQRAQVVQNTSAQAMITAQTNAAEKISAQNAMALCLDSTNKQLQSNSTTYAVVQAQQQAQAQMSQYKMQMLNQNASQNKNQITAAGLRVACETSYGGGIMQRQNSSSSGDNTIEFASNIGKVTGAYNNLQALCTACGGGSSITSASTTAAVDASAYSSTVNTPKPQAISFYPPAVQAACSSVAPPPASTKSKSLQGVGPTTNTY